MSIQAGEAPEANQNLKILTPREVDQIMGKFRNLQKFFGQKQLNPEVQNSQDENGERVRQKWTYKWTLDEKHNSYTYSVGCGPDGSPDKNPDIMSVQYIDHEGNYSQYIMITKNGDRWEIEGLSTPLDVTSNITRMPIPADRVVSRAVYLIEKYKELRSKNQ